MKKYFLPLFLILFSFLGFSSVNALSLTIDYSSTTSSNNYFTDEQINSAESLINYLDNSSFYSNYDYFIKIYTNGGSSGSAYNTATAFIVSKLDDNNYTTSARYFNRTGYSSFFNLRWYSGQPIDNGIYSTRLYPTFYSANGINEEVGYTLSELQQFEQNNQMPTSNSSTSILQLIDFSPSTSDLTLPNGGTHTMLYYSSVDLYTGRLSSDNASYNSFDSITFVNSDSNFSTTENFGGRFYSYRDTILSYANPIITDFGNGQLGIVSNNITIDSSTSSDVMCPDNTDFINDFCITNQYQYSTDDDLLTDRLITKLNFKSTTSIPYVGGHYYLLTYRMNSTNNIFPTRLFYRSGLTTGEADIVSTKIIDNAGYKDIQVLFTPRSADSNISVDLTEIYFFSNQLSSYEVNVLDFNYGIYKIYKYSDMGTTLPTDDDLNRDYNNNSINDLSTGDNSFFTNFGVNLHGFSSIITSPLRLFNSIIETTTCSDVVLPVPHFGNITLPCISSLFSYYLPTIFSLYQVIASGVVCYWVAVGFLRTIKKSFDPTNDEIEVADL